MLGSLTDIFQVEYHHWQPEALSDVERLLCDCCCPSTSATSKEDYHTSGKYYKTCHQCSSLCSEGRGSGTPIPFCKRVLPCATFYLLLHVQAVFFSEVNFLMKKLIAQLAAALSAWVT